MGGLAVFQAAQFSVEHVEIVGDCRLNFFAAPIFTYRLQVLTLAYQFRGGDDELAKGRFHLWRDYSTASRLGHFSS